MAKDKPRREAKKPKKVKKPGGPVGADRPGAAPPPFGAGGADKK